MEQQPATERPGPLEDRRRVLEDQFQALPPLGSDEYIAYVRTAAVGELAPEVLVRAFRQMPPSSPAARETLERLFLRRPDKSWDYLGPMVSYARRRVRKNGPGTYEDLLQDGVRRIVQNLAGKRGNLAEHAWNSYCRQELTDAWRERYGRRGERYPAEELVEESDDDSTDPLDCPDVPSWHACLKPNAAAAIEKIASDVLVTIPDAFIRQVARIAWFNNERPKVSGTSTPEANSLMSAIPGKSRFQILRALRHADAQLAAALLADAALDLTPEVVALIRKLNPGSARPSRCAKERR